MAGDDLIGAFQDPPPGPAQPMFYRQGLVVEWDRVTGENVINVSGTLLENLPIFNTTEAVLLRPGHVVGLMCVGSTWGIFGRMTIPGTPDAVSALTAIGAVSAEINPAESTGSTSFTDLATPGPEVEVEIGASGRALSIVSATIAFSGTAFFGAMGVALSDGNTVAPDLLESLRVEGNAVNLGASRVTLHTGLNPGLTTFTAKYIADANFVFFSGRTVTVIAL